MDIGKRAPRGSSGTKRSQRREAPAGQPHRVREGQEVADTTEPSIGERSPTQPGRPDAQRVAEEIWGLLGDLCIVDDEAPSPARNRSENAPAPEPPALPTTDEQPAAIAGQVGSASEERNDSPIGLSSGSSRELVMKPSHNAGDDRDATESMDAVQESVAEFGAPEEAWTKCLAELRKMLLSQSYDTWLKPLRCLRFDSEQIVLHAPHSFAVSWVAENYVSRIQKVARHLFKIDPAVTVDMAPDADLQPDSADIWGSQPAAPKAAPSSPPAPEVAPRHGGANGGDRTPSAAPAVDTTGRHGFGTPDPATIPIPTPDLRPEYTFETFVVGQYNQMAAIAAQNVAGEPGTASFNPLLVYGGVGLGKTHLLHAVAHATRGAAHTKRVLYVTSEQFAQDFVTSLKEGKTLQFARAYRSVDVLLLDDIQFFEGKERMQEEFFHTFNTLHTQGKQIVLSSDRAPENLAGLQDRLLSRIQWGLVADIQRPDLETRAAICQRKAELCGLDLPFRFAEYIAEHVSASVREIEKVVHKLVFQIRSMNAHLTKELVEAAVGKGITRKAQQVSILRIRDVIANRYGMPTSALLGKSRRSDLVARRQMAMYFCKLFTTDSLRAIGQGFGGRNHATVLHSVRMFEQRLENDTYLRREANAVAEELGLPPLFPDAIA